MKKIFILFGLLATINAWSQVPTYRWVSGSQERRAQTNLLLTEPGARNGLSSFTDEDGNLWIFGGEGRDFTNTSGFLNDTWKYDRFTGAWQWVDGQMTVDSQVPDYNNALSYDGLDDIVKLYDNPISYTDSLTIEAWIKPNQDGIFLSYAPENKIDAFDGWRFEIVNSGTEFWIIRDQFLEVSIPNLDFLDDQWHHIAVVFGTGDGLFQNQFLKVYIDGELLHDQFGRLLLDNIDGHTTYIGGSVGDNDEIFFNGQIDEVRFWDVVRTQGEIISNKEIELPADVDGLKAYYTFNQGTANSAGNYESELLDLTGDFNGDISENIYRDGIYIGQIAEVRVWDSALDVATISNLAGNQVVGNETGLLAAYDFMDGVPGMDNTAVTALADLTVNANDGSLQNLDLSGLSSNFIEDNLRIIPTQFSNPYGGERAAIGYFDGDTFEDVVTITNNQTISVLLNDQAGGLGAFTEFAVGSFARDVTVGHFNDDNFQDIAVTAWANGTDDRIRVFFGDGMGDFPTFLDLDPGDNTRPQSIKSADLNGDTFDDIVVGTYENTREDNLVNIYLTDGLGGFEAPTTFDVDWIYSQNLVIADVNNDTFLDIALGSIFNNSSGRLSLFLNDGAGNFTDQGNAELGPIIEGLTPFDVDQDGNIDFLFHNGGFMGLLKGNGDGTFQNPQETNVERSFSDLLPLRFEGENLLYLASSRFDQHYFLYQITPNAEITKISQFNTDSSPGNIQLVDLDKNGITDLIIPESTNRINVILRENEGFSKTALVQGLDFDGVNDHVEIATLRPYNNSFTIEAWVKTEDNGPIFSFTPQGESSIWQTGSFSFQVKEGRLTLSVEGYNDIVANQAVILDNEWHHIALTMNVNPGPNFDAVSIYLDGNSLVQTSEASYDETIAAADMGFVSKLGYATGDFKNYLGTTGQSPLSNWVVGVTFLDEDLGRAYNAYWSDDLGNFYQFGGKGKNGSYNSVRSFDKINNEWVTLKGDDFANDAGSYGSKGIPDPLNIPPSRWAVSASIDPNGEAWLFGGVADTDFLGNPTDWFNDLWKYNSINNEWVWVSGPSTINGIATYGTKGVSDPLNMPGPRSNYKIWSDADGYIWLFGGYGLDAQGDEGYLNDLWKFDPNSLEWTWISGSDINGQAGEFGSLDEFNETNYPGARAASLQWIDSNGKVWLFGGEGADKFGITVGYLNDLWCYDPTSNQWAWHSGSDFKGSTGSYNQTGLSSVEYVPGSRRHSAGWIDEEDKLWLFGGYKFNQLSTSLYNDFWNYNIETKEWTWLSGFNSTVNSDELGVYGDLNEGSLPHPGSRHGGLSWTDNDGNFWMLGGAEIGSGSFGFYNDLWKYEPTKNEWRYILGNTKLSLNDGVYGSKGIGSINNDPKSRWHGASWTGDDGKLWFFGGINYNTPISNIGWLNDLWFFDPESGVYTWIGGNSSIDGDGIYGVKGQASTSHIPGARSSSAYWSDEDGNFWLFGGYESFEYNNDLWKFNPNTLEWTWVSGNNFQNAPGIYGELGVTDPLNSIGARRYTDGRIAPDGAVWIFGGDGHDSQAQRGWLSDLWKYNPIDNTWTWVSGSEFRNTPADFGVKGVASPDNMPPPRYGHSLWIDDSGNIWLFGGFGLLGEGENQASGQLNDLWKFDIRTNLWTWVGGSDQFVPEEEGVFGTQGVFSENNVIFGRARSQTFMSNDKSLWFFGGRRNSSVSFNDFWQIKFTPGLPFIDTPSSVLQKAFSFASDEAWANAYRVQVALSDDFSDTFYNQVSPNAESIINNLNPGTYYYYRVDAINEIGNSGFGATQQVLTLPATPTFASLELALSGLTSTQVFLDWENTEGILDGYYIDVSRDPTFVDQTMVHEDFSGKSIAVVEQQELQNLTPGTRYYARLQSYNASGVSPFSQVVPFLTKPATVVYPAEVVTEVTQVSAIVNWEPVPEIIDNYRITVSTLDDGFTDETQFLVDYNQRNVAKVRNTITVSGLAPGTSYFAVVSAVNASGESEQPLKITILTAPSSPVFDVESSILTITQNAVSFNWEPPQGFFEGYRLEVSTDPSFVNTNLMLPGYGRNGIPFELAQSDLTTSVAGLSPGQTYYARIRAYNSAGVSPNSNILIFTTVPRAPTLNNASNISQNGASINWQAIQGSDVYLMDLNTSTGFENETSLFTDFPLAVPFQVLEDLTPGTRYFARVQSSNISGNSGDMDPADYGYTNFITIPGTPVLAGVDQYTQTSFTISWPEVEGASEYEVDVSDNFFQTFLVGYNGTTITTPQIEVSNLDQGSDYQIRVRAKNVSGKSPNAGIFDLLTLPGTPTARDATNSSSSVFTANWDPADGADFYILEVSLDNFITLHYNEQLASSNPIQITDLVPGATYKYRVKALNASGESPYSSEVTVIAQNTSQSLSISSLTFNDEFGETATSAVINVKFTGGLGNPTVTIRHKEILSNSWSSQKPMTEISPTEFEFTILSNMLDDIGVVFEVFADDGVTFINQINNKIKRTFTETNSESLPALNLGEWSMVSIPYVLEDNLVTSIFNELGDLTYKKRWRLMTYLDGEYQDQGVGFTRIELGRGYWFNSLNDVKVNVGAGETNSTVPFDMALEQGWNQIGNPYNVTINWDNILDENSLPININQLVIYDPTIKEFIESSTLAPFSGAFVFADQAVVVSVDPTVGSNNGRKGNSIEAFSGDNWIKSIKLNWGNNSNEIAAIGMHHEGDMSKDRFDKLVIPRFENYLEMYTTDDSYFYPKFSSDIKTHEEEYIWNFNLESNHVSGHVSLEWDPELLEEGRLWLVDDNAGRITEMSSRSSYSFNFGGSHQFSVHYSSDPNYIVTPSRLTLGDAYPNPINSKAYIPVFLPERDVPYSMQLNLFDLQGKLVKKIVSGEYRAGVHIFELDIDNGGMLTDGLYFYKVSFDGNPHNDQQKKIFIKR